MVNGLDAEISVQRSGFHLDLHLQAAAGEVVALLGPNGAGKTTALRAVAGLVPGSGPIRVGSTELTDLPPQQRRTGLVFQDYRLFPHLTVLENVAFGPRSSGQDRRSARATAQHWVERLDLVGLADRKPARLSGGQSQRVALARALATDPLLLLLDEPLAALDAQTRHDVRSGLRDHLATFAGPTVLVTHDPLEALVLADRLVVLEGGVVTQQGTPGEVARRPATAYVARLMGLNLYAGRADGQVIALDGGGSLVVPGQHRGEVLVAVRPSALAVSLERPVHSSARNAWPGVVKGLELLTDRVRLEVTGQPPALVDVTPASVAELGLRPDKQVWLSVKATEVDAYPR